MTIYNIFLCERQDYCAIVFWHLHFKLLAALYTLNCCGYFVDFKDLCITKTNM